MGLKRKNSGFTLVELLVVLGIILLLVGVSVPAITTFMKGKSLDNAGRIVQTMLMEARRATVTKKVEHRMVFFSKQNDAGQLIYGVKIYRQSTPYDTATDKAGYRDKELLLAEGLDLTLYYTDNQKTPVTPPAGPPAETAFKKDSDPSPFKGKLEFQKNGSLFFAGDFADVSSFDPEHIMEDGSTYTNQNMVADIIISQKGSNKKCFLDLMPLTGRAYFRALRLTN